MKYLGAVLGILIAAVPPQCTMAKEGDNHGNHGELKSWFDRLASKRGLCCSFTDGVEIEDVDVDTRDGHYLVRLNGQWVPVPDNAVIEQPNRYGRPVVWPIFKYNSQDVQDIRCFLPGAGT